MNFLKELFEENKVEIKEYGGLAITLLCLGGIIWLANNLF